MENSYFNLFIKVKTLEEIKETATIVIDTNVLLLGYQSKNITFERVLKVLTPLSDKGRLKIPSHVVKEFSSQRPYKIEEMSKEIHNVKSNLGSKVSNKTSLEKVIPALSILEKEHSEIIALEDKYNKCIEELNNCRIKYVEGLTKLQQISSQYIDHDLILKNYEEIIRKSYFEPEGLWAVGDLEKEWERRKEKKIPPGHMDSSKKVNKYGDLIIWNHICQIQNDVIFVTNDVNKGDWVYKVNEEVLGARRELVEEFYTREQSSNHTLKVLTPLQFITLFSGEEVKQEIKDDLNKEIKNTSGTGHDKEIIDKIKEMVKKTKELREKSHLKDSNLKEGFDEIEGELNDWAHNMRYSDLNHYLVLVERYKEMLETFAENPSSEYQRGIDVEALIATIESVKEKRIY
ncbi:PIN-like domain-containing protein [Bacillus paramycoides]|uniref:PIN-like domain-containing protein n=1 Tax=Bacillus paramycoides TaxID=2026194 RepID=UPI002E20E4A9|nr:PIN-like domain-containing protein [Bacillus paramycoides]